MRRFVSFRGLALAAVAWLAIPAIALADDCSAWTTGEVPSCLLLGLLPPLLLVAAALLAAASWLGSQSSPAHPPNPPHVDKDLANFALQDSAYDPGGSNMGGGPSGDL